MKVNWSASIDCSTPSYHRLLKVVTCILFPMKLVSDIFLKAQQSRRVETKNSDL